MCDDTIWDAAVDRMAQEICDEIDAMVIADVVEEAKQQTRADYDRAMEIFNE